jgi:hypothetical protein
MHIEGVLPKYLRVAAIFLSYVSPSTMASGYIVYYAIVHDAKSRSNYVDNFYKQNVE